MTDAEKLKNLREYAESWFNDADIDLEEWTAWEIIRHLLRTMDDLDKDIID